MSSRKKGNKYTSAKSSNKKKGKSSVMKKGKEEGKQTNAKKGKKAGKQTDAKRGKEKTTTLEKEEMARAKSWLSKTYPTLYKEKNVERKRLDVEHEETFPTSKPDIKMSINTMLPKIVKAVATNSKKVITPKSKQVTGITSKPAKATAIKSKKATTSKSKQVTTMSPKIVKSKLKKEHGSELKRHLFIYRTMAKGSAKKRNVVLKKAPLSMYKSIRLLFKLMKNGTIPLKKTHKARIKPWVHLIRKNSRGKLANVKRNVSQEGEGLGSILKTILPIITPILSMIF